MRHRGALLIHSIASMNDTNTLVARSAAAMVLLLLALASLPLVASAASDRYTRDVRDPRDARDTTRDVGERVGRQDGGDMEVRLCDRQQALDARERGNDLELCGEVVPPPAPEGTLLITEVLYDVGDGQGAEPQNEWVEIRNGTNSDINLSGYSLHDSSVSFDVLPDVVLPAGGFAIVTNAADTADFWTIPDDAVVVVLGSPIGNGLSNAGDHVSLHDASDAIVDSVGWGTDTGAFGVESGLTASAGSSLARTPMDADTDTAADWEENTAPTPGS